MLDGISPPALFTESEILDIVIRWANWNLRTGDPGKKALETLQISTDKETRRGAARELLNLFLTQFPGYEATLPISLLRKAGKMVSVSKTHGPLAILGDYQLDVFDTEIQQ